MPKLETPAPVTSPATAARLAILKARRAKLERRTVAACIALEAGAVDPRIGARAVAVGRRELAEVAKLIAAEVAAEAKLIAAMREAFATVPA